MSTMTCRALAFALLCVACGGSDATATTSATSEPDPAATGGETPPPAVGLTVTGCGSYTHTPEDCSGTPENPDCTQNFELHGDGTGEITFDDIIMRATYEVSGSTLTLRTTETDFEARYAIEAGGEVLVGDQSERYARTDCAR
jgi:hypothetical protein